MAGGELKEIKSWAKKMGGAIVRHEFSQTGGDHRDASRHTQETSVPYGVAEVAGQCCRQFRVGEDSKLVDRLPRVERGDVELIVLQVDDKPGRMFAEALYREIADNFARRPAMNQVSRVAVGENATSRQYFGETSRAE
jgi:hypothetical protein